MKIETIQLENKAKNQFVELNASDKELFVRRGLINEPCLIFTINVSRPDWYWKRFEQLKDEYIQEGYELVDVPSAMIDGSKAILVDKEIILSNPRYSVLTSIGNFEYQNDEENFNAWHFSDGLNYNGDLDIAICSEIYNAAGLIIEGDSKINGVFGQYQDAYPDATLFLGNVSCQTFIHENSHVVIDGNLSVKQTIFGNYNDGSLKITGDALGEAMISYDHEMWAEGEYHLFHGDLFNEQIPNWLNPKLLDLEDSLDTNELLKYIYEGKSILRKGVSFKAVNKTIENEVISNKETERVEEQPLIDPALMDEINEYAMQNNGMGITLAIVNWSNRDDSWLQLLQSRLSAPSATDKEKQMLNEALEEYQQGTLSSSEDGIHTPADTTISAQSNLKWNPPENGQVSHESFAHPLIKTVIDNLYESDENAFSAIAGLQASKILNQHASLLYFEAMEGPPLYLALKLVERLLELDINPNIEADSEHECGSTNPLYHAHKVGHTEILGKILKKYPELQILLDDESDIEGIKDEIRIDKSTIKAAKETAKIVEKLNRSAIGLQQDNARQALDIYEEVIDKCEPFLTLGLKNQEAWEYNYIYAYRGKLWCLNDLIEKGDITFQLKAEEAAQTILNFRFDLFHYSEAGAIFEAAIVLANNSLAWYSLQEGETLKKSGGDSQTVLEKALAYSNVAIENMGDQTEETIAVVIENKIRILLALDQKYEAYSLLFRALKQFNDLPYFNEIASSDAYKKWNTEN